MYGKSNGSCSIFPVSGCHVFDALAAFSSDFGLKQASSLMKKIKLYPHSRASFL